MWNMGCCMKICYITDCALPWSVGGAEKRLYEISSRMKAKGHDVTTVCMKDKMHFTGERRSILHGLKFAWQVFNHLRKNKYDYIEAMQSPVLHIPIVWLMKGKAKFVVSWFEVWNKKVDSISKVLGKSYPESYWINYAGHIVGRIGMFCEWLALRLPDAIIVPSEQTKQDVLASGVTKSLSVVHNGIDFQMIQKTPFKKKYDLISVGRLIRGKRVDLLIESMHALKHFKPDINAVVVGDGPEMERLKKHAKAAGVDIDFVGNVEKDSDVYRYIQSSKVAVHPSEQEGGASISLLEFNACGIPVVSIKCPLGISEEFFGHNNGYLAKDFDDMVRMIKVFLGDDTLRDEMRESCIEFAKGFDWSEVIKQYEKAIE